MDGSRFDAWTRRRFGILAGGTLAAALGLAARDEGDAKKKKKRCRKLGKTCKKSGNNSKKKCCGSLKCDTISFEPSTQTRCCRKIGQGCADNLDCCAFLCCAADGACTDLCAQ